MAAATATFGSRAYATTRARSQEEDEKAKEHAAVVGGRRPPSMITAELRREFAKYRDAHKHASESDTALQRAISAHLPHLNLLSGPLDALEAQLPSVLPAVQRPEAAATIAELQRIVDKVSGWEGAVS